MNRIKITVIATLLAIGIGSCSTVAISGRNRIDLVPDAQVLSTSFAQYAEFISKAPKSKDAKQTQRVIEIGQRIAKATDTYLRSIGMGADADNFRWEFNLIADRQANAFCMPGGKIVVYEGILPVAKTDGQLATVISHEVAHAVAKHANERMSQQILQQYGAGALSLLLSGKGRMTQQMAGALYSVGTQAFFTLPYSRKHEYEADIIGLYLMAIAGYDYSEAIQFWTNMAGDNKGKVQQSDFWSTHPNDANRIKKIREELPRVKAFMEGGNSTPVKPANQSKLSNDINKGRQTPLKLRY